MKISMQAQPIGSPRQTSKKTGFIQRVALMENGRIVSTHSVFSDNLDSFNVNDKGLIPLVVQLPEDGILMVARNG